MTKASAFVLGYHGCDRAVAERVIAGKEHLKASDNDYDWLGSGIYFWENSARRALDWAVLVKANPKFAHYRIRDPFVLGAIIDLGNCLDLLKAESIRTVEQGHRSYTENCHLSGIPAPQNRTVGKDLRLGFLDCAVINYVHLGREAEHQPAFDALRAAFIEGSPLYRYVFAWRFRSNPSATFAARTPA
jgi:hypothetical protein